MNRHRPARRGAMAAALATAVVSAPTNYAGAKSNPAPPISWGSGSCGEIDGAVPVPCAGDNFSAGTQWMCLLGRTYAHPLVTRTLEEAFQVLAEATPEIYWQYGDIGAAGGGPFWPHRTHQNGLSVDIFLPARKDDAPALLPIAAANAYGYGIAFDSKGRWEDYRLDWQGLAALLLALENVGAKNSVHMKGIIFWPPLRHQFIKKVPKARRWRSLFNRNPAWVRHDDHIHIDFELPNAYRRPLRCE